MARGIEASEAMVLLLSRSELSLTKCHGTLKPQHAYSLKTTTISIDLSPMQ